MIDNWNGVDMSRNPECVTINLPFETAGAVRDAVEAGEYPSSGDVVREALEDWRKKRAARASLTSDIGAGLADIEAGRVGDFDAEQIISMGREKRSARSNSD